MRWRSPVPRARWNVPAARRIAGPSACAPPGYSSARDDWAFARTSRTTRPRCPCCFLYLSRMAGSPRATRRRARRAWRSTGARRGSALYFVLFAGARRDPRVEFPHDKLFFARRCPASPRSASRSVRAWIAYNLAHGFAGLTITTRRSLAASRLGERDENGGGRAAVHDQIRLLYFRVAGPTGRERRRTDRRGDPSSCHGLRRGDRAGCSPEAPAPSHPCASGP